MQASRYNFWSKTPEGVSLLYNGRNGALIALESSAEVALVEAALSGAENRLTSELLRLGFLWDDSWLSEQDVILARREQPHVDSSTLDITISPTYQCNFRCTYCYVDFDGFDVASISDTVEARILDYLSHSIPHFRRLNLTWFGGEPLLHWQQVARMATEIDRIGEASGCTVEQFLTTNGYLLSPQVVDALVGAGIKWIHITIDGCDQGQDTRRVLSDGSATYQRVRDNLIDALIRYPLIGMTLRMNLEPNSVPLARPLLEAIPQQLRSRIQVHPTPVILDQTLWGPALYQAIASVVSDSLDLGYAYYDNEIPVRRRYHCGAENPDCFQIGPDGSLHKCSPSNKPEVTVGIIGNQGLPIFSENNEIWLQAQQVSEVCRQCPFLCFCLGGCRLDRLRNQTDPRCRDQYSCMSQHIRNLYTATRSDAG